MYVIIHKKTIFLILIGFFIAAICTSFSFYSIPAVHESEGIAVTVVMYHGLCSDKAYRNEYMIAPELFEEDLKYLRENGYTTIFPSELIDYFDNNSPLPEKPVILTFDDGYLNNYTIAYPLLKKYGMKAVISPIGISADEAENEKYRNENYSQSQWKQLKEMSDSGFVEIQNHSYNLHRIKADVRGAAAKQGETYDAYKKRLQDDLKLASSRIKEKVGKEPYVFVYPFGAKSNGTEEIVKEMGFSVIFDCENRINRIRNKEDLLHLHRFIRPDRISSEDFFRDKAE